MSRAAMQQALEALIEAARILGATQAKKGFGLYTSEDGRLEQVLHESLAKHSNTLRTALAEPEPEPETYKRLYELRGKALERPCFHCGYKPEKIYPMEQRLKPEQEPVAWMHVQGNFEEPSHRQLHEFEIMRGWTQYPLYTHPAPQPVTLTDAEIYPLYSEPSSDKEMVEFARAVIEAYRTKQEGKHEQ